MGCRKVVTVLALARVHLGSGSPDVPRPARFYIRGTLL